MERGGWCFYAGIGRGYEGLILGDWEGDMGAGTGRAKWRNQDKASGESRAGTTGFEHKRGSGGGPTEDRTGCKLGEA